MRREVRLSLAASPNSREHRAALPCNKGTPPAEHKVPERFVQKAFGLYEDMERRGLHLTTQVIRQSVVSADEAVAPMLGLDVGTPVHVLVRIRSVEAEKLLLSTTYIPENLCPQLVHDDVTHSSLYRLLDATYGLQIARGERSIEAVAAGEWEATLLAVKMGSPLLRLESIAYREDGRAFEYSHTLQRGARARIELDFIPSDQDHHSWPDPRFHSAAILLHPRPNEGVPRAFAEMNRMCQMAHHLRCMSLER